MQSESERTRVDSLRSRVVSLEENEKALRKLFGLSEIDYSAKAIHRRTPEENRVYRRELEEKLTEHLRKMEKVAWILPE